MTSTIYVPLFVVKKNKVYNIHRQWFIGNLNAARERKKELVKQFPAPEFVVRRLQCAVTIYK